MWVFGSIVRIWVELAAAPLAPTCAATEEAPPVVEQASNVTACTKARVAEVARAWACRHPGLSLRITSGVRTAQEQAELMYAQLRRNRRRFNVYGDERHALAEEVATRYDALSPDEQADPARAIPRLVGVLEAQVARGAFVSRHLSKGALDLGTREHSDEALVTLVELLAQAGGEVFDETRDPRQGKACGKRVVAANTVTERFSRCPKRAEGQHLHVDFAQCRGETGSP